MVLAEIVKDVARAVQREFSLDRGKLAISLWHSLTEDRANFRGQSVFYPASVIKLYYMAALFARIQKGKISASSEIQRALRHMIQFSSNDATNFLVDVITGTTSGPELDGAALLRWVEKRRTINRWIAKLGWPEYKNFNATQKTWDEGPYGREWQSRFVIPKNRNRLSTEMVARFLFHLSRGELVSRRASKEMQKLLERKLQDSKYVALPDHQVKGFFGEALPKDTLLMSKAGWTSDSRHDSAIIHPAGREPFVLVAFTSGQEAAANKKILPFIAQRVFKALI